METVVRAATPSSRVSAALLRLNLGLTGLLQQSDPFIGKAVTVPRPTRGQQVAVAHHKAALGVLR